MIKDFFEKRFCVLCGHPFWVDHRSRKRGPRPYPMRIITSVTCSTKCSNEYRRIKKLKKRKNGKNA